LTVIEYAEIVESVRRLCIDANIFLNNDIREGLKRAAEVEESPTGCSILKDLIVNADIAAEDQIPICQDTGMAVFFIEYGQDIRIEGGALTDAINEGVRAGYRDGFLRKSVVRHPWFRENTGDNTPAVIHYEIVRGDQLRIIFAPKGFGSENMSRLRMLKPSEGKEGVLDFIVETVELAGPNPCPPVVVGVGVGGTMEKAAILAKRALFRPLGTPSERPEVKEMEEEALRRINCLGIGPQGLGGRITALAVNIELFPTHIAGLPVAVNINCHATRHREVMLGGTDGKG
jgi:fumarate hydratase subunit alpha